MRIAVIDYGIGNLRSAEKALQHLGADATLTADADAIAAADAVVLPGVGRFGACMRALRASGLESVAKEAATDGRPFLGVCVGMQMLFEGSDESPDVPGLGVVAGRVTRLPDTVRLPQIGWNTLESRPGSRLGAGLGRRAVAVLRPLVRARPDGRRASSPRGARTAGASRPRSSRARCGRRSSIPRRAATRGCALLTNFVEAAA